MQIEKRIKQTQEHFLDFVLGVMVNWEVERRDALTPAEILNTIEGCKYDNTPEYFKANNRLLFQVLNKLR